MTVRNIKKNLAGAEDLLHGIGLESQVRGGAVYDMHKLDTYVPTYDIAEMQKSSLTFMRLYGDDTHYTDYRRNPAGTVGIPSDLGGVWEPIKTSELQVVGNSLYGAYVYDVNQVMCHAGTRYSWSGAFPKVVSAASTPETTGGVGAGAWVERTDVTLRSELADPAQGAAKIARGVVAVDSIADLLALSASQRREDLRYSVKGYHAGSSKGGGLFAWEPLREKNEHDGGYIIDPDKTSETATEEWYAPSDSGLGCFVRVNIANFVTPEEYGAKGNRAWNDYFAIKACHENPIRTIEYLGSARYMIRPPLGPASNGIPIYDGHDLRWNYCWIDCDLNTHQARALYYFDTRQAVAPTRFRRFTARNVNLASSLGYPAEGSVTAPQYRHFIYIDGGWWQGVNIDGIYTPEGGTGLACRSAIMCDLRSLTGADPGVPDTSRIANINLHYAWSSPCAVVFLGDDLAYGNSRCDTVELDNILVASAPFIYDYHSFGTTNTRDGDFAAVMIDDCRFGYGPIHRVFDKYTAVHTRSTGVCNRTKFGWLYTETKELRGTSRPAVIKGRFNGCDFQLLKQWIDIFTPELVGNGGPQLAKATATDCVFRQLQYNGRNKNDQRDGDLSDLASDWFELLVGSRRNKVLKTNWAGRNDDNFNNSDVLQSKMKMPPGNYVESNLLSDNPGFIVTSSAKGTVSELFRVTYSGREYRDTYEIEGVARTTRGFAGTDAVSLRISVGGLTVFEFPFDLTLDEPMRKVKILIYMSQPESKGVNRLTDAVGVRVIAETNKGATARSTINIPDNEDMVVSFVHPTGVNGDFTGSAKIARGSFYTVT